MSPARFHRVRVMWRRLRGWRTFIFFTPAFLLTLSDALHVVDFRQLLLDMGLPELAWEKAPTLISLCLLHVLSSKV